jgi:hypothetical protein
MRLKHHFYHAWIAAAWLGVGCAPNPQPQATPPSLPARAAPAAQWPKLAQVLTWPKLEHDVKSGGHSAEPYHTELHVDPTALPGYQRLVAGAELPVGSTLVQFHRAARGDAGPIYVMEKSSTGWSFSELDPAGHVLRAGNLVDCARCHAEGVSDSLFGPDRSAPQAASGASKP